VTLEPGSDKVGYYADAPNRLIGYLIDAVFLTLLSVVGAVVISVIFGPVVTIDQADGARITVDRGLALANAVLGTTISGVYFIGGWRWLLGSPGQRMLRMQIASEGDGGVVTYRQGFIRWLCIGLPLGVEASLSPMVAGSADTVLFLVLVVWYLVLLVSTARSPTKQGLQDRLAHTVVTKGARAVAWPEGADVERGAGVR
jgi:hypothetical protein